VGEINTGSLIIADCACINPVIAMQKRVVKLLFITLKYNTLHKLHHHFTTKIGLRLLNKKINMGTFFIVGGSSGIGKSIQEKLRLEGHLVYSTYFKSEDVTEEELDLSFLPDSIDGIVYCPGAIDLKPFTRLKSNDIHIDLNLQVLGAVKVIQSVLPKLKASGKGSIVLFSTVAVQTGFPFHAQVAISKGAIEGLTRSLAAEFAPTIRVNAIAPSITNTPLAGKLLNSAEKIEANGQRHPLKRIGEASDIAELAAFLLTDKSSWITGQIMHIDGGMSSVKI
jgi:NAD(P)-dependent dehydrogenase (short-subunit alcohol dehydrogenase family)